MSKHFEEHYNNPDFWNDPKNPKLGCMLQASGANFDPNMFPPESKFLQGKKFFSGIIGMPDEDRAKIESGEVERNIKARIEKGELPAEASDFSAFEIFDMPFLLVRISEEKGLIRQIEEVTAYLQEHSDDLINLFKHSDAEYSTLTFASEDRKSFDDKVFSPEFFELIKKIGIRSMGF